MKAILLIPTGEERRLSSRGELGLTSEGDILWWSYDDETLETYKLLKGYEIDIPEEAKSFHCYFVNNRGVLFRPTISIPIPSPKRKVKK